jgi:hypothetical protein
VENTSDHARIIESSMHAIKFRIQKTAVWTFG